MSVESGLGAPVDRVATPPTAPPQNTGRREAARPTPARRGPRRVEALADAVSTPSGGRGGKPRPRARRVRRVVRRIELWSVLKISLVFNTVMLGVALATVAVLWALASTTGVVEDLEGFLRDSGFEDFRFQGDRMFRQVAFIGAVVALAFTVFVVLATALVNLISEVTGGIRFTVLEEIVEPLPEASGEGRAAPQDRGGAGRGPRTQAGGGEPLRGEPGPRLGPGNRR